MVMKSAEDGRRYDAAHVLDGAMDRSRALSRRKRATETFTAINHMPSSRRGSGFATWN
jgi:hypothetical protein